jgi:hypothetical protein
MKGSRGKEERGSGNTTAKPFCGLIFHALHSVVLLPGRETTFQIWEEIKQGVWSEAFFGRLASMSTE